MNSSKTANVLIVRRVKPGHEDALEAKIHLILAKASAAPGYVMSQVMRGREADEPRLYVMLSFADHESWLAWSTSPTCRELLEDALKHVLDKPEIKHGEGFAGWFDLPKTPMTIVPPKWKMAVVTWIGIFPTLALFLNGTAGIMGDLHPLLRLFLNTLMIVPLMTWIIMPTLTKLLRSWIFASSPPRKLSRYSHSMRSD